MIWRLMPLFIRKKLEGRDVLKKLIGNTGWLLLDKVLRLFLGAVVGIFVARYLGPSQFGMLNYAISLVAFIGIFAYLGLDGLIVRDIVKTPKEKELILGTAFMLKAVGGIFGYIIVIIIAWLAAQNDTTQVLMTLIVGAQLLFRPFEVIDAWFQSQVQAKYSVYARNIAFIFSVLLKIFFIIYQAPLFTFALTLVIEMGLASIIMVYYYVKKVGTLLLWQATVAKGYELISQSWLLILSGFLATINLKVDQILLNWLRGPVDVGIYSVAVVLSESWYFIPIAIVASLFPKLAEMKENNKEKYKKSLQQTYDILFLIALSLALPITFLANKLIYLLYGPAYQAAGPILMIHIWSGLFIFMRQLFSRWLIIEGFLFYSLMSHGLGAIANVILNLILIRPFGGVGSAVATLISYAIASYFALFFTRETRETAKMMTLSMLSPFRLILKGKLW